LEKKKEIFCLAIMLKILKDDKEKSDVPKKIQFFLDELIGIVANDRPMGMLHRRSSSHHIDLILGSSLPTKDPYQMTLEKR
jgi:hypothetical protein